MSRDAVMHRAAQLARQASHRFASSAAPESLPQAAAAGVQGLRDRLAAGEPLAPLPLRSQSGVAPEPWPGAGPSFDEFLSSKEEYSVPAPSWKAGPQPELLARLQKQADRLPCVKPVLPAPARRPCAHAAPLCRRRRCASRTG